MTEAGSGQGPAAAAAGPWPGTSGESRAPLGSGRPAGPGRTGTDTSVPVLRVAGLSKTFLANRALADFDLALYAREIHVLLGENGSGKSTLIKVLSGYHVPDPGGRVEVDGKPLEFGSSASAYRLGCRFVHQDLGLIPALSVLDNLSLGAKFPTRFWTIRKGAALRSARQALARVNLDVDPRTKLENLTAAQRSGVAIARALREDSAHLPRLLVLDEPTAALPSDEVDHLLEILRAAARSGVAIMFVTHHLNEVFQLADRVTVLRDGVLVKTSAIGDTSRRELIQQLVGHDVEEVKQSGSATAVSTRPVLSVSGLASGPIGGVAFTVAPGEVVGVAGLTGSGRESVLGAIYGAIHRHGGDVHVDGTRVPANRPDLAMKAGINFLPADRKTQGGIMAMSALDNLMLPKLRPFWARMHLNHRKELNSGNVWMSRLNVKPGNSARSPLASFSGGNQQKILFGKWLRCQPKVFLLDEPTQGVDIAAKAELHRELLAVADQGTAVLVGSTDVEELCNLCHRILIFSNGRVIREIWQADISVPRVTESILSSAHRSRDLDG